MSKAKITNTNNNELERENKQLTATANEQAVVIQELRNELHNKEQLVEQQSGEILELEKQVEIYKTVADIASIKLSVMQHGSDVPNEIILNRECLTYMLADIEFMKLVKSTLV